MEWNMLVTGGLCFGVGIFLGLLGGGGSILMVPILVYVAGLSPQEAITLSLVVIGFSSIAGTVRYIKHGQVNKRLVLLFSLPGVAASFIGARFTRLVDGRILLFLFGLLMILIAVLFLLKLKSNSDNKDDGPVTCHPGAGLSVFAGAGTGFLTGFMGVGGGFLIVPVIALMMKCSIRTAIGTSLAIIAVNSGIGFLGHWGALSLKGPLEITVLFTTFMGAWAGGRLSLKFSSALIQSIFSILIFVVGLFLCFRNQPL